MNDEWYSFKTNPRANGAHVLATLDESTYSPGEGSVNLRMGAPTIPSPGPAVSPMAGPSIRRSAIAPKPIPSPTMSRCWNRACAGRPVQGEPLPRGKEVTAPHRTIKKPLTYRQLPSPLAEGVAKLIEQGLHQEGQDRAVAGLHENLGGHSGLEHDLRRVRHALGIELHPDAIIALASPQSWIWSGERKITLAGISGVVCPPSLEKHHPRRLANAEPDRYPRAAPSLRPPRRSRSGTSWRIGCAAGTALPIVVKAIRSTTPDCGARMNAARESIPRRCRSKLLFVDAASRPWRARCASLRADLSTFSICSRVSRNTRARLGDIWDLRAVSLRARLRYAPSG